MAIKTQDSFSLPVSIIVAVRENQKGLRQTLGCLSRQTVPGDFFEVIVCVMKPCDGVEDVVATHSDKLDIRCINSAGHVRSPNSILNDGIANARGRICTLLDSGVIVNVDLVRRVSDFHERRANAVCIAYVHGFGQTDDHPALALLNPVVRSDSPERCFSLPAIKAYADNRQLAFNQAKFDLDTTPFPWEFWSCLVSIETVALKRANGFDEDFEYGGRELAYRLWHRRPRKTCRVV